MKRTIDTLNQMSFELPKDWQVTVDKYNLVNGQGFINTENYLSQSGKVISLFEIHREPNDFFEYYQTLVENYNAQTDFMTLKREFTFRFGEYAFPVYILKGTKEPSIYIVQVFVNCGDKLGCFMLSLDNYSDDNKKLISNNPALASLTEILRTVE